MYSISFNIPLIKCEHLLLIILVWNVQCQKFNTFVWKIYYREKQDQKHLLQDQKSIQIREAFSINRFGMKDLTILVGHFDLLRDERKKR